MEITTEQNTEKELSDYKKRQKELDSLREEKVVLTKKINEMWEKSQELISDIDTKNAQMEYLKQQLEKSNENARVELAKKNAEIDQLKSIKPQNEGILKTNGALNAQLEVVKNDLLMSEQRYNALKSIETGLNSEISGLKVTIQDLKDVKRQNEGLVSELNSFKKSHADLKNNLQISINEKVNLKTEIEDLKSNAEILKSQNELLMSCEIELNSIKDKSRKRNNNLILFISALAFIANLKHLLAGYLAFLPQHAKTGSKWVDFSLAFLAFLSLDGAIMLFIQHKKNTLAGLYTAGTIALTLISLLWIDIRGFQIAFGVISCIMISGIIYAFSDLKNK